MAFLAIYVIFFDAFFGNSLIWFNVIPPHITLVTELAIYFLLVYSFIRAKKDNRVYHAHLFVLFAYFLIITFCSTIINERLDLSIIISLRRILRFYIFYVALINLGLDDRNLRKINMLLFVLFILQLPASAAKFCVHGVSEWTTGTYDMVPEGKTTMMIPIIALGYLAGYYFFYNRKYVYWLLGIGFILFGILSGKAAHLFVMPITFLGLYYLIFIRARNMGFVRNLTMIAFIVCFSIAVAGAVIKFSPRLNPEKEVGGTLNFSHALNYSKEYTTAMRADPRYAGGRFSATMLTFHIVWKGGLGRILFGYGPGSVTGSMIKGEDVKETFQIQGSYGNTGLTVTLAEYGLFGAFVFGLMFVIFVYMCFKWYNCEEDHYWKAFATGSVVFSFLNLACFFGYSSVPILGDTIPPLFYYAMAVTYLRLNKSKDANTLRPVKQNEEVK